VAQILLVVVLSIYFMLDGDHLGSLLMTAVPARYRDDFIYLSRSLHQSFGGFLRGQVIQALIYGIGVAIIMTATGLPFTALSSVVAGLAMFIPIFGPPLGIAPPLLVIVTTDVWRWWVLIPIVLLNTAVVNIVAPKVMGHQIGLHPTIVLAAVLVGARVAGPWGAVFGAPVVAVIANMIAFYRMSLSERSQQVRAVTGEPDPDTVTEQPIITTEEIAAVVDGRKTDG
jgi:predicted PurR-regulated permease PerM